MKYKVFEYVCYRIHQFYLQNKVEGVCIEGHEDLIGDRASFRSDKIYLTKNSFGK